MKWTKDYCFGGWITVQFRGRVNAMLYCGVTVVLVVWDEVIKELLLWYAKNMSRNISLRPPYVNVMLYCGVTAVLVMWDEVVKELLLWCAKNISRLAIPLWWGLVLRIGSFGTVKEDNSKLKVSCFGSEDLIISLRSWWDWSSIQHYHQLVLDAIITSQFFLGGEWGYWMGVH